MTTAPKPDTAKWFRWVHFGEDAEDMQHERRAKGEELEVTDDHRRLLGRLTFALYPKGGDVIYMGVDGKRPFGNSSSLNDVAEILEWDVSEEHGLTEGQSTEAVRLMSELPDALTKIIRELPLQADS